MGSVPPAGTAGLTYADLLTYPTPAEARGIRYELLDGELIVTPAPSTRHQRAATAIAAALWVHTREHGGVALAAPTDVWFSDETVVEPDVVAVAAVHLDQVESHRIVGPPDLVVEVSSPSTRRTDLIHKRRRYERENVPEFWFVDLDADQVHVYRLDDDGRYGPPHVVLDEGVLTAAVFPGFTMPAAEALASG